MRGQSIRQDKDSKVLPCSSRGPRQLGAEFEVADISWQAEPTTCTGFSIGMGLYSPNNRVPYRGTRSARVVRPYSQSSGPSHRGLSPLYAAQHLPTAHIGRTFYRSAGKSTFCCSAPLTPFQGPGRQTYCNCRTDRRAVAFRRIA